MAARVPFIAQMETSECGLACFAMILGYYQHHTSLHELRELYYSPKDGLSFYQLKHIAEEYHLLPTSYSLEGYSLFDLKEEAIFPCILHWEGNHFVVLERLTKKHAFVVDPAAGRRKLSQTELDEKATGYIMTFEGGEKLHSRKKPSYLTFLLSFAFQLKKHLFWLLAVTLLFIIITLMVPLLTRWATDTILVPGSGELLPVFGVFILALTVARFILSVGRGYIVARFQKLLDQAIMTHFISHLLKLPYSFFENRSKGDLLYRANANVHIRDILSTRVVGTIVDGFLIAALMIGMLAQSLLLGTIVIACSLIIFIVLLLSTKITRNYTNKQVLTQTKTQSVLAEQLDAVGDMKVLGLKNHMYEEWADSFQEQVNVFEKTARWTTWLNTFSSTIQFVMPLFLLWLGGYQVINGSLTLGTVLSISSMASMFLMPIVSIGSGYMQIIFLSSILQRLYDVLLQAPEEDSAEISFSEEMISLSHVSFSYGKFEEDVLSEMHFSIRKGEKVGIIGDSGSGKSTIAKLAAGLYQPTSGTVFYHEELQALSEEGLLSRGIGAVLQETKLFNRSILENITVGVEQYSMENVIEAAKHACIHEEIEKLPMKYETVVSEGGTNFSGGQRQRLILARVLFRRPIVLILDEATSALNPSMEAAVIENLNRYYPTQIIISHQRSLLSQVDHIYKMKDKQLVSEVTME
ncbi:peptidase domain-containing ABC transporter [Alteribacillus sp. HJP-4]|uniref:peptidase domain-containing ABC transporter n=1 Tax=Alteribacillus sp. HJP-4 TaxID=2775394 RepID=UPI0035CD2978